MLYQIKDKSSSVLGVHECSSDQIRNYLSSLPRQGSPYSAHALPTVKKPFKSSVNDAIEGWSLTRGLIIGALVIQPLDILVYFTLSHFGVI